MKRKPPVKRVPMSPDAYAGFLALLLTPAHREPKPSPELDAYLRYLSDRDPLPDHIKRMLGLRTVEAA